MKCPECDSSDVERTFTDLDNPLNDEYECRECGLVLELLSDGYGPDEFVAARIGLFDPPIRV